MSTIKSVYLQHLNGTTPNATMDTNGNFTVGGTVSGASSNMFRNRIINGDMRIDQRNAGASVTPASGTSTYLVDRWRNYVSQASKLTAQQNAGSVTPPAGFSNYMGITSSSSYAVVSSDIFTFNQPIEGYNVSDLAWGTANAKTVTLSFWVRSSLTGTFGGALGNSTGDASYPFTYIISSANTWEQKTITITGATTGTWNSVSSTGIFLIFGLGVGSTWSGTAGSWSGNNYYSATGATSVVGTNGATWYITGVQFEVGTTATPFEFRQYGTELALCQRYYQRLYGPSNLFGYWDGSNYGYVGYCLPVTMRTAPTSIGYSSLSHFQLNNSTVGNPTVNALSLDTGTSNPSVINIYAAVSSGGSSNGKGTRLYTSTSTAYIEILGGEL